MSLPPVTVIPMADESIPSMIWRQRRHTARPIERFGFRSFKRLYDDADAGLLAPLGEILGVEPEVLVSHTLSGHLGPAYDDLSWRDHRMPGELQCPGCGLQPVWARLVLCTSCSQCGLLLTEDKTVSLETPTAAREMQATYLALLADGGAADDLRMNLLWRLLSFHLCTGWSTGDPLLELMPVGTELSQPRTLPWRDPMWVARFATTAWPATETVRTFREHVRAVAVGNLLGDVPADIDTVKSERERLHRDIRDWGLVDRHVPDHLLGGTRSAFDGCHIEAVGYAVSRAMRREVIHAHTGHRPTKEELLAERGYVRQRREIAAINQLFAHDPVGLRILHGYARQLAGLSLSQRADYPQRRASLAALRQVPAVVTRRLNARVREREVASRVRANPLGRDAAAWLWIEFGGGVLQHSPFSASMRIRLRAFDRMLTPEDRLVLLEYGHELLGVVADDVVRADRQTSTRQIWEAHVG